MSDIPTDAIETTATIVENTDRAAAVVDEHRARVAARVAELATPAEIERLSAWADARGQRDTVAAPAPKLPDRRKALLLAGVGVAGVYVLAKRGKGSKRRWW